MLMVCHLSFLSFSSSVSVQQYEGGEGGREAGGGIMSVACVINDFCLGLRAFLVAVAV